jgi:hypothetical protein
MHRHALWQWSLMLTAGLGVAHAVITTAPEYQVKAAFVYKFATYIHWPTETDAARPFVIGVIGTDPFGPALNDVVSAQRVRGRAVVIRKLNRPEDALHYDVLFISSSERGSLRQILAALGSAPVLTVSDLDQFAEQGGMIGLVTTEDNLVRFEINRAALDRAGLKAPSQLLRLARLVDESRTDGGRR